MSKKHKKVCKTLNYIEHLPILVSLVGIPAGIASSGVGIKICAITAIIKKFKSIIKKKRKNMIK